MQSKEDINFSAPAWLSRAVFYEIYPPSFCDSNGDGIGDLAGILARLDYIQSLGCNAIWLNPCWDSPFEDGGYDVSDFYKVAPRYGSNTDLQKLIKECHRRGMKIILDLVPGHTSNRHPWFQKSAKVGKNKYSNWYIWTDSVWRGTGCQKLETIRGFGQRDGAYVSNYFHFQPALNYGFARPAPDKPWQLPMDHPDVRAVHQELRKIMAFWLKRGVDGFRVDMASSLIKGEGSEEAVVKFWQDVRAWLQQEYPESILVAEWSDPKTAINAGFHNDFLIHFGVEAYTYLFRAEPQRDIHESLNRGSSFFDRKGRGDIRKFLDVYLDHYRSTKGRGFISIPSGNHDIGRLSMGRTSRDLKVIWAFLMTMPGVPYIYYGDEIGLRQVKCGGKEGGFGRTGARTPMQWDDSMNAGFSTAASKHLYLPQDKSANRPTIAAQLVGKKSLLNWVKALIALRSSHPALSAEGSFKPVFAEKGCYPFAYLRESGDEKILIAVNPSACPVEADFRVPGAGQAVSKLMGHGECYRNGSSFHLKLPAISAFLCKLS